jgi:hypothetical protein
MTITMRPARSSARISSTELSDEAGDDVVALPARGRTLGMRAGASGWVDQYTRRPVGAGPGPRGRRAALVGDPGRGQANGPDPLAAFIPQ